MRRLRDWLSCFVPALPWLITAVLIVAVLMILVSALRPKAHAQFGGVQQPMFGVLPASSAYPAENLLLLWSTSDFGVSNDVSGLLTTNMSGATADHWYFKTTYDPAAKAMESENSVAPGANIIYRGFGGPLDYPYMELAGTPADYFGSEGVGGSATRATMFMVMRIHEYGGISLWDASGGHGTWFYLSGTPTNTATFNIRDAAAGVLTGNSALATNVWCLFTFGLRDPQEAFWRLNGVSIVSNSLASSGSQWDYANFAYGKSTDSSGKKCDIVEVRVYTNGLATADMVTIENLLIAKYSLPSMSPPMNITNYQLAVYDVDALASSDGTAITSLTNNGTGSFTLTSDGTVAPYWTNNAGVINNEGFAWFDGSNDYLTNYFDQSYPQPTHVFAVAANEGVSGVSSTLFGGLAAPNAQSAWEFNSDGTLAASAGTQGNTPALATMRNWMVWEVLFNGSSSYIRTNNTLATNNIALGANARRNFVIGNSANLANPFKGGIAWMGFYTNALDSVSASNLVQSLGTRYGITTYTRN